MTSLAAITSLKRRLARVCFDARSTDSIRVMLQTWSSVVDILPDGPHVPIDRLSSLVQDFHHKRGCEENAGNNVDLNGLVLVERQPERPHELDL